MLRNSGFEILDFFHDFVLNVIASFGASVEISVDFSDDLSPGMVEMSIITIYFSQESPIILNICDFLIIIGIQNEGLSLFGVDFKQHLLLLQNMLFKFLLIERMHLFVKVELFKLLEHTITNNLENPKQIVVGLGLLIIELPLHLVVVG